MEYIILICSQQIAQRFQHPISIIYYDYLQSVTLIAFAEFEVDAVTAKRQITNDHDFKTKLGKMCSDETWSFTQMFAILGSQAKTLSPSARAVVFKI